MALSQITMIATGASNMFAVNFALGYGQESEVTARVGNEVDGGGNPVYRNIDFSIPGFMVVDGALIPNGTKVVFTRTENKTTLDVDWEDGASVTDENLNAMQLQALRLIHEVIDGRIGPVTGPIDMGGNRITNVGDPIDLQDAATKNWTLDQMTGSNIGVPIDNSVSTPKIQDNAVTRPKLSAELRDSIAVMEASTGKLLNSTRVDYPIVLMYTGQSNMLGHSATGGDRSTKNRNLWIFESVPSEPGQTVGWKNAGPDSPDWPMLPTGNSIPWHVGDMLQRATGRTVLLIGAAAGGQPVSEWLPGGGGIAGATGAMWAALTSNHALALDTPVPGRLDGLTLRQTGRVRADILLWHQGEADANYRPTPYNAGTKEEYKQRFLRFLAAGQDPSSVGSSAEPFLWYSAPVIMGELLTGGTNGGGTGVGDPTDSRNDAIAELAASYPFITSVSARNLASLDNLHFTGAALVEFAWRYYRSIFSFPKNDLVSPALITDCNSVYESGIYKHSAGATGAPLGSSGFLEHFRFTATTDFGNATRLAFAYQRWHQVGAAATYERWANISGVWQPWIDRRGYDRASAANIRVSGAMKLFKGTITVPTASTATVTLPETMLDATYIPNVTVITFAGATPVPQVIVSGKTTTQFTIENKHAVNSIVVSWTVFDAVA